MTTVRHRLLAVLLVPLGLLPVLLAVSATDPVRWDDAIGMNSALAAVIVAVAAGLGLLLVPVLAGMGRIGAAVLALPVAIFLVNDARSPHGEGGSTGAISLDILLSMMIPTGYFLLLFGALRAAGWARSGAAVVLGAAVTLSVAIWVIPSPPYSDIQMGNRMVVHGLINAGILVAAAGLRFEVMASRVRGAPPPTSTPTPADSETS